MTLIGLIIFLVVVGIILYIIQMIPMDALFKRIVYALFLLFVVLWLLRDMGWIDKI